jgi:8-oxo-dGTP pyrophosphatase MutT (NUDIX family)
MSHSRLTEQAIVDRLLRSQRLAGNTAAYAETDFRAGTRFRCAAVLVPLTLVEDEWHVLFTRRTDLVESHKGQVSFPGGACDDGDDSAEYTALREAHEEIGLIPADVRVLGRLLPMITISKYEVTPVVAVFPMPYTFRIATIEVARVFTIPLAWLGRREHYWEFPFDGTRSLIAYHPFDGELLWGATARMTVQLVRTLGLYDDGPTPLRNKNSPRYSRGV